jgi:hypothetical protein
MQIITIPITNILWSPAPDLPAACQYSMAPHLRFLYLKFTSSVTISHVAVPRIWHGLLKLEFTSSVVLTHGAVPRIYWIIETRIYKQYGNIPWRSAPDLVDY